ncbi:MAG: hypothetical protein ABI351_09085 [Herbaspirillum sp.]
MLLGTLVTISSIGARAVGASLMALMYPRLSTNGIVGTNIAYTVPLIMIAIAIIGHWWSGSINCNAASHATWRSSPIALP